jgi:hypothetical protein
MSKGRSYQLTADFYPVDGSKERNTMVSQQIILLILNAIGGAAVIGSYVFGLQQGQGASALWGGVPDGMRTVYTISMLLSALSFFLFIFFILFRLHPDKIRIGNWTGFGLFYAIFSLILIPSAIWMPLTNAYIAHPSTIAWILIRLVLILVGLGSIALVWALFRLQPVVPGLSRTLAIIGASYFAFHTAILDAIVWAALFRN